MRLTDFWFLVCSQNLYSLEIYLPQDQEHFAILRMITCQTRGKYFADELPITPSHWNKSVTFFRTNPCISVLPPKRRKMCVRKYFIRKIYRKYFDLIDEKIFGFGVKKYFSCLQIVKERRSNFNFVMRRCSKYSKQLWVELCNVQLIYLISKVKGTYYRWEENSSSFKTNMKIPI